MLYRIPNPNPPSQRDVMRRLFRLHQGEEAAACAAYVEAERQGHVCRKSNDYGVSAEVYARELFRTGVSQGWIKRQ